MKILSLICAAALLLCTVELQADSPERDAPRTASAEKGRLQTVPNLLIIKLREQQSFTTDGARLGIQSLDQLLERIGAEKVEPFNTNKETALQKAARPRYNVDRMVKVRYTSGDNPSLLAMEVSNDPSVEYAEPYYIFPFHYTPNDTRLAQQWAIDVMKLKEAWDITKGDSTIIIGDVDSGVDWTHPDLAENIWTNPGEWGTNGELKDNGIDDDNNGKVDDWHGWDFIGDGSSQSPIPDNNPMDGAIGHGTNTSGCAAARTDNATGVAGSSFSSKILAIKAAANSSTGIAAGYDGILYAAQMGAHIINCSWGGTGPIVKALQDIVDDVTAMGSLVVGSSGNDPLDNDYIPHTPSALDHVLNVGSVESNGNASQWCTYGTSVHVYSPGNGITTTRKGGSYTSPTGTSFSAPLAAGVAALVMSVHPDWTPDQVAAQIRVTSDRFGASPASKRYGRINAFKAVSLNENLTDIPGVRMKSFAISYESGSRFSEPGQTAHVTVVVENVLAPTSENAILRVNLDDPSISTDANDFPLGVIETFGTKTVEFDIALSDEPETSEGYIPVRMEIIDGEYVDYFMGRASIFLNDAWHTSMNFGAPYFTSIDAASVTSVWGTANVSSRDYFVRSLNGGGSWSVGNSSGFPSGKGVYCIDAVTNNVALVGTGPSTGAAEVFRTVNSGSTWSGTSVAGFTGFVNWIHMYDINNGILQGDPKDGVWGIATTDDGGATWTPLANPVNAPTGEAGWNNAYDAAGDTLWFGTNNSKIYRSTDRGQSWTSITTPSKHSVDMAFADSKRGIIRFTTQTNLGGTNMLAVTEDGGDTWLQRNTIQVSTGGTVEMEENGRRIWFIQGTNAWVSDDMAQSWTVQAVPSNFANVSTSTSFSNTSLSDVYTAGIDIFKFRSNFDPYGTTSVERPVAANGFHIDYMYPNPISTSSSRGLTLGLTLESRAGTQIDVFDNLGRLVLQSMRAELTAGSHTVNLDTGSLPTGNYRVRVQSGAQVQTTNLLVIH
ncbi:MAG: hypothetical protein C0600_03325 [Ignavibacteria bacterium]|nr:MAG: hypothetical protein C0600_03325 [Ignavibacteria bacterium]